MTRHFLRAIALSVAAIAPAAAGEAIPVCVDDANPPFASRDLLGDLEGFEIDLGTALGETMERDIRWVATPRDRLIADLEDGACDAILSSLAITDDHRTRVAFTAPYYRTHARLAAEQGVAWSDDAEGLAGRRICVQAGTAHEAYARETFPDSEIVRHASAEALFAAAGDGDCDTLMADGPALREGFLATLQGGAFAVFGGEHFDPAIHGDGVGIGVRPGDDDLREAFDAALAEIRESGVFEILNARYFPEDVAAD